MTLYVVTHTLDEFKAWQYRSASKFNSMHISTACYPIRLKGCTYNPRCNKDLSTLDPFSALFVRAFPHRVQDQIEFFGYPEKGEYAREVLNELTRMGVPEINLRWFNSAISDWLMHGEKTILSPLTGCKCIMCMPHIRS